MWQLYQRLHSEHQTSSILYRQPLVQLQGGSKSNLLILSKSVRKTEKIGGM